MRGFWWKAGTVLIRRPPQDEHRRRSPPSGKGIIERIEAGDFNLSADCPDIVGEGLRIMRLQRDTPMRGPRGNRFHAVGEFCQVTTMTRDGAFTRILDPLAGDRLSDKLNCYSRGNLQVVPRGMIKCELMQEDGRNGSLARTVGAP